MTAASKTTAPARAGQSAQQEYERQRTAWVKRNRRFFRCVDAAVALITTVGIAVWLAWPTVGWFSGLLTGIVLAFAIVARLSPPIWIERWQVGAVGEQRTGRVLSQLGPEWTVRHDLRRQDGTNVDHVVVGPAGVFLLDSKHLGGGEIRVDGDELRVIRPDGKVRTRLTLGPAVRGASADLSRRFRDADAGCWVRAVVVVWGDMPRGHVHGDRLDWVFGPNIGDWLQSLPPVNPKALPNVAAALTAPTFSL